MTGPWALSEGTDPRVALHGRDTSRNCLRSQSVHDKAVQSVLGSLGESPGDPLRILGVLQGVIVGPPGSAWGSGIPQDLSVGAMESVCMSQNLKDLNKLQENISKCKANPEVNVQKSRASHRDHQSALNIVKATLGHGGQ